MAKSRNNLLGVGGQRRKPSRPEQQGAASRGGRTKEAAEAKADLLRRMRERTRVQERGED
ncbi:MULTISPECIES: DUF6243 family protein [Streptomyces]|uniref:DUF6243 family protein n=1 Tax=Streptomyces sudanensis TaxID=436397 RepID=A0ABY4TBB1_9ACTN|nr:MULTISPECIES: DUF6243 family protein [Streptomyces]MCP9959103.1 DUF6243 family protein [Streptomyces sudanensis]MCP9988184.1 DUF6243 family protein [Streptomyces sudanensis]MCQ0000431.1 DUF6243 family protein [Streptomyces sudanensis]URN15997.1 DUF6243 family protein [Streptomyces sudanensis]